MIEGENNNKPPEERLDKGSIITHDYLGDCHDYEKLFKYL